jgi:hypothetical protein
VTWNSSVWTIPTSIQQQHLRFELQNGYALSCKRGTIPGLKSR